MAIRKTRKRRAAAADLPTTSFSTLVHDQVDLLMTEGRVFKTGNSLAIRIPSALAKHAGLEDGTAVELAAGDGMIYLRKAAVGELTALLARITPQNVHAEHFDKLEGFESW